MKNFLSTLLVISFIGYMSFYSQAKSYYNWMDSIFFVYVYIYALIGVLSASKHVNNSAGVYFYLVAVIFVSILLILNIINIFANKELTTDNYLVSMIVSIGLSLLLAIGVYYFYGHEKIKRAFK